MAVSSLSLSRVAGWFQARIPICKSPRKWGRHLKSISYIVFNTANWEKIREKGGKTARLLHTGERAKLAPPRRGERVLEACTLSIG
jgi:hypothetical protein